MTVALNINRQVHVGWSQATVTRSLETVAGTFSVTLSERDPGETQPRVIRPGDTCIVALDDETVISGYVDTISVDYSAGDHTLGVRGRDATGQLVDCSAATMPGEWHEETLENIATALCEPFDIPVTLDADQGERFTRFRIEEGETAFEAIERACRFRAVLPLSDGKGGLVLGGPNRSRATVRLEHGVNILSASGSSSWLARYSEYKLLGQQAGNDFTFGEQAAHVSATAMDPGITRYRPLTIIGERTVNPDEAQARVTWESNVRAARGRTARVSLQGWRETPDGPLWAPGRLVRLTDAWLGIDEELLVSQVSQSLSANGTITELDLVPEDAFLQRQEPQETATDNQSGWWS